MSSSAYFRFWPYITREQSFVDKMSIIFYSVILHQMSDFDILDGSYINQTQQFNTEKIIKFMFYYFFHVLAIFGPRLGLKA